MDSTGCAGGYQTKNPTSHAVFSAFYRRIIYGWVWRFQTGIDCLAKFNAISASLFITHNVQINFFVEENTQNYTQQNQANEDVLENILNRENFPVLRFDCGENGAPIGQNRILHESILLKNIPHI